MLLLMQSTSRVSEMDHHEHHTERKEHKHKSYGHMDLDTAKKWVREMKHADGTKGEHWTPEQTAQVLRQKGFDCESPEFYAVMNMLWSDYCKVAEKFGVNNLDFWASMAHAFLMDEDAEDGKTMAYYECVADK